MRIFLGVHKFAPLFGIIGDMGWPNFNVYKYLNCMRLWNKLVLMQNSRLTKLIFVQDCNCCLRNTWGYDMFKFFRDINKTNLFHDFLPCNLDNIKEILIKKYTDIWKQDVLCKPKLRFYKQIKDEPTTDLYLKLNLSLKERSYLAQLRLGILPIEIEIGRYRQIPVAERVCKLCDNECIEDECHILFHCPAYENERKAWLDKLDLNNQIINNSSMSEICKTIFGNPRQIAKYLITIMEIRKFKLFI